MKTLYLELNMGAAGDMLSAALLELLPDPKPFVEKMNALGLEGVRVEAQPAVKCGVTGTHVRVTVHGEEELSHDEHEHHHEHEHDHEHHHDHEHEHHHDHEHDHEHHHDHEHDHDHDHEHHHDHEHDHDHDHDHGHHHHHHASMADIMAVIDGLDVSDRVKADAKAVYGLIAEAESHVHGTTVDQIHFHEVGTMDAVADVLFVCLLMEAIAPDQVVASPVHVGSGQVRCMHGILPVPAPATAHILTGIPTYGGQVRGELCTPTGAALLKHFVTRFGDRPVMSTEKIGYGMGQKDFERANCVRAFLGESAGAREEITRLECNLDDITGEDIAFAMERLFEAGARDVYTQPIGMKKSRPGVLLSVIALPQDADRLAGVMMKHTTTLGIRRQDMSRYALERSVEQVDTPFGSMRVKTARGMGVEKTKYEYEDLAAVAKERGMTLAAVRAELGEE
ncbi:MAG: nickel pincer cofactor biosynthesis protein LarC [Clostridiales bacterium]|nr:nickel pincer cofactor biosynthesis protein LarC [Clostridiales bacterium]